MKILSVRVTQDEIEKLRTIAVDRKMTVSEFVRNMVRDRLSPPCVTAFEAHPITTSTLTRGSSITDNAVRAEVALLRAELADLRATLEASQAALGQAVKELKHWQSLTGAWTRMYSDMRQERDMAIYDRDTARAGQATP